MLNHPTPGKLFFNNPSSITTERKKDYLLFSGVKIFLSALVLETDFTDVVNGFQYKKENTEYESIKERDKRRN